MNRRCINLNTRPLIAYFLLDNSSGGKGCIDDLLPSRVYDWTSKDNTSEMAVWTQMVEDETLDGIKREDDEFAITVMPDLIQVFETIRMRDRVETIIHWKFEIL